MLQENDNFDERIAQKEQEWKGLLTERIQSLVTALQDSQTKLKEEQEKFNILKEDFMFNLKVLEERDQDLERYDAMFAQIKVTESCKQAEISELQIHIDKLENIVAKETKVREELQFHYQQQLKTHQLELEKIHSSKDSKINGQQEEYKKLKQELERKVQEVEGQLVLQKQELLAEFDAEMRHREHDFALQRDEMNNVVLSNKLKVKLLSKELELLREAGTKASESLQIAEKANHQMAKQLQRKEFELKDAVALKEARIKDLEDKINRMEINSKNQEEMFQRNKFKCFFRHSELDRLARERDAKLATAKQQIRELNNKMRELQISLETVEMEKWRMEWSHADATKVKEDAMEKYKQQLVQASERERGLEQMKVQAELDWQQRCEEIERSQYLKSEELIQSLSQARDQVTAELREKERKLQELETFAQALTLERDQAIVALQKHGVFPERDSQVAIHLKGGGDDAAFPSDIIHNLQQQNLNLRTVITQMRKEMEILSDQIPAKVVDDIGSVKSPKESSKDVITPEYTKSLEGEVHELKQKCRKLEDQLEDIFKTSSNIRVQPLALSVTAENAYLQNHTRTLNETIAGLRAENISVAAAKEYEARIVDLESLVTQLTQQVSSLKLDLVSGCVPVVVEQNEFIKELQKEILQLRKKLIQSQSSNNPSQQQNSKVLALQTKLKHAARYISQLSRDKQQLIEIGNRLRAELVTSGLHVSCPSVTVGHSDQPTQLPRNLAEEAQNRLFALERLQYQLTTQELQYAQLKHFNQIPITVQQNSSANEENGQKDDNGKPGIAKHITGKNQAASATQIRLSKENKCVFTETDQSYQLIPEPSQSQPMMHSRPTQTEQLMSSYGADSSIQGIWKMLEGGPSPQISPPQSNTETDDNDGGVKLESNIGSMQDNVAMKNAGMDPRYSIQGTKAAVQIKTKPCRVTVTRTKQKHSTKTAKIRNYNLHD
ncbi:coiled-coil domain-containing protein 57 isoform X4 [Narcine bancroftii]|uniref:coiled-coil domain-containing protein 57 isoform X4 n=1 Tax=Narcine bancroftii TaxID=1343680 RepID=UPI003831CAFD